MREQEPIQMNIQLPAEALDGFTRLVEQLRLLAAEVTGGGPEPASGLQLERGDSATFDLERFQALRRGPDEPEGVRAPISELDGVEPVRSSIRKTVPDPESAWAGAERPTTVQESPAPPMDRDHFGSENEPSAKDAAIQAAQELEAVRSVQARTAQDDFGAVPVRAEADSPIDEAQSVQAEPEDQRGKIPAVRAEAESRIGEAPAVRMEPESQIPEAEAVWAEDLEQTQEASGVRTELSAGADAPQSAGYAVLTDPEAARSRWSGVTEELFTTGPAPLTAEAVSLAFRRDDRRYDSGFPLY